MCGSEIIQSFLNVHIKTKVTYFMIRNQCGVLALYMNKKTIVVSVRIYFLFWGYYVSFPFIKKILTGTAYLINKLVFKKLLIIVL